MSHNKDKSSGGWFKNAMGFFGHSSSNENDQEQKTTDDLITNLQAFTVKFYDDSQVVTFIKLDANPFHED